MSLPLASKPNQEIDSMIKPVTTVTVVPNLPQSLERLRECLANYSGGLGILSGDNLKSASDLGLPLVGIGILYQEGYFSQYLNADGYQQEAYPVNDYANLPVTRVTDSDNKPRLVGVPIAGRTLYAQIWLVQVGRVPLY